MAPTAARTTAPIPRPLQVLVPLIHSELDAAETAGLEHYRRAGALLREAHDQVEHWGAWLSKHFRLSRMQASRYMRFAAVVEQQGGRIVHDTLSAAIGEQASEASRRTGAFRPILTFTAAVDPDRFSRTPQPRVEEIRILRALAREVVDLGFKAAATRLHPDHGGSSIAMQRLNQVRVELKRLLTRARFD